MNQLADKMSGSTARAGDRLLPPSFPGPLSPDRTLETARATLPGATPTVLQMSRDAKSPAFVVMRFPEDRTPAGRTRVLIDVPTGRIVRVQSAREMPIAVKYARMWNRELHTGDLYGLPTRIVMAFFSLMLPVLAISGPLIWWMKRRVKQAKVEAAA